MTGSMAARYLIPAAALALAGLTASVVLRGAGPLPGDVELTRSLQGMLPLTSQLAAGLALMDQIFWALPLLVVVGALLLRRWQVALLSLLAALVSLVSSELLLKALVARPRPTPDLVQVYTPATSYGFPSTTTLLSLVVLGIVGHALWLALTVTPTTRPRSRLAWALLVAGGLIVLLVGLARIALGTHWPSDIIGSLLIGSTWLALLLAGYQAWVDRQASQPTRPAMSASADRGQRH